MVGLCGFGSYIFIYSPYPDIRVTCPQFQCDCSSYLKRFLFMSSALILDSKVVDGRPSFRAAPVEPDTLPLDSVNAPRNLLKLVPVFGGFWLCFVY